ncbi:hypothetical protein C457_15872 [Haloferax prahovense DSM 18310]|uniref:Uncharacterized protein n=1 Tax=Haloferax prahovense (strain DSM 18310 / JCM 13924 / TL6) TaxID=1227461 RepID=M0G272_HALPT|nr:hypothetical protein C457_15872 [Haloferax prahovense DSM 18310]
MHDVFGESFRLYITRLDEIVRLVFGEKLGFRAEVEKMRPRNVDIDLLRIQQDVRFRFFTVHIDNRFTRLETGFEEMCTKQRFSGTWLASHQIHSSPGKPSMKNRIQPGDS